MLSFVLEIVKLDSENSRKDSATLFLAIAEVRFLMIAQCNITVYRKPYTQLNRAEWIMKKNLDT